MKSYFLTIFAFCCLGTGFTAQGQSDYLIGTSRVSLEPDGRQFSVALAGYGGPREGRFSIEWKAAELPGSRWKKEDSASPKLSISGIGVIRCSAKYGKILYIVNAANELWAVKQGSKSTLPVKIGRPNGLSYDIRIMRLFVQKNKLYAVSDDKRLYLASHLSDHNLSASALAIRKGSQTAVIVGVDLTGFDYSLVNDIRAEIFRKKKIPKAAIMINASHTHFAPVSQNFPTFGPHGQLPDSTYLNGIVKKGIIMAIERALDDLAPGSLHFGRGQTNIGFNRSSGNAEAPNDKILDVVKAVNPDGSLRSILFLAGCHPVAKNEDMEGVTLSANYPGVSRREIEASTGTGNSVFLQGCGGDINPRSDNHTETGKELAGDVEKVLKDGMTHIEGSISYSFDTLEIPVIPWSLDKVRVFKNQNVNHTGDIYAEKNVRWADMMLGLYQAAKVPQSLPVYVQEINIGNWKLVGLSREVVNEYAAAVRGIWPKKIVSVAGYCNDLPSYLPNAWHIQRGVYEGNDSFFWNAQPAIFPENVFDLVIQKIRHLSNK